MKTHDEWIAYFRELGLDNGDIWHLMDGLSAMRMVGRPPPDYRRRPHDSHVSAYYRERLSALCRT
jgi:hypothetical protein